MKKVERIHFLSRPDRLHPLRKFVKNIVNQNGFNKADVDKIVMAVNEASMNIIQHGYKGKDDGEIVIEFYMDNNEIKICILDYAEQANLVDIQSRDLSDIRPGGLGVHIINEMMDFVEYRHQAENSSLRSGFGNLLEMRKRL